jgi:hypothetical protein
MPKATPEKPAKIAHGDKFQQTVERMLATPPKPKGKKKPAGKRAS